MSIDWNELQKQAANQDLHVQTTEPLFDGQSKGATILAPQVVEQNNSFQKGIGVVLSYKIEDELEDVDQNRKAPGYVVRERFPFLVIAKGDTPEEKQKMLDNAQRGIRSLAFKLEHAGLVSRGEIDALPKEQRIQRIMELVPQLEGRPVIVSLNTRSGNPDKETGEVTKYQQIFTSAVRA